MIEPNLIRWMVDSVVGATVLLLVLCFASVFWRNRSAANRHGLWAGGLIGLMVVPSVVAFGPRLAVLPSFDGLAIETNANDSEESVRFPGDAISSPWIATRDEHGDERKHCTIDHQIHRSGVQPTGLDSVTRWSMPAVCLFVWMVGSAIVSIRLLISFVWLASITCRRTGIAPALDREFRACISMMGIHRHVELMIAKSDVIPMATGVLFPKIVLPAAMALSTTDSRRIVMMHELGHVARRDPLWHCLVELAGVLYWFHPLYWYARHQCASLRECACDDRVLNAGVASDQYARCLLAIVSGAFLRPISRNLGVAMASSGRIEKRIRSVMKERVDRRPVGRGGMVRVVLFIGMCLIGIGMVGADAPPKQPGSRPVVAAGDGMIGGQPRQSGTAIKEEEIDWKVVSGRVLDAGGAPLPGAAIYYSVYSDDLSRKTIQGQTADDGSFTLRFRVVSGEIRSPLAWFHADGHAIRGASFAELVVDQSSASGVEIRLPHEQKQSVRVFDPGGSELSGAVVFPESLPIDTVRVVDGICAVDERRGLAGKIPHSLAERIAVRTDAKGKAWISAIPLSGGNRIAVRSDRFGTQLFRPAGNLRLQDVGEIRGRVVTDHPERIAGTELSILSLLGEDPAGYARVQIDQTGRFYVPAYPSSRNLVLYINWDDELKFLPSIATQDLEVRAGEVLDLEIQTVRAVEVSGRVLKADSRQPVGGARVSVQSRGSLVTGRNTLTDDHGKFKIHASAGDIVRVVSMGTDWSLYERYEYPRTDPLTISDDAEQLDLAPFLLPLKRMTRGQLTDSSGNPIVGATVVFQRSGRHVHGNRAVTQADGKFVMPIRNWESIRSNPFLSRIYHWEIEEGERVENGIVTPKFATLHVAEDDDNYVRLERR